jgi:hypothetical protein
MTAYEVFHSFFFLIFCHPGVRALSLSDRYFTTWAMPPAQHSYILLVNSAYHIFSTAFNQTFETSSSQGTRFDGKFLFFINILRT